MGSAATGLFSGNAINSKICFGYDDLFFCGFHSSCLMKWWVRRPSEAHVVMTLLATIAISPRNRLCSIKCEDILQYLYVANPRKAAPLETRRAAGANRGFLGGGAATTVATPAPTKPKPVRDHASHVRSFETVVGL